MADLSILETFNWQKLWDSISSLLRQQLPDTDVSFVEAYWEAIIRALDDAGLQLTQYNNSKGYNTVPTLIRKTWLLEEIDWDPSEAAHDHFKKEFVVASTGDTDFDLTVLTQQPETFVYLNHVRVEFEPGLVELDNSGTTSVVKFPNGLIAGDSIIVSTIRRKDGLTFIADGNTSVFLFGGEADEDNVKIKLNNISISDGIIIGSRTVIFRGGLQDGDTVRIERGSDIETFVATADQTRVAVSFPIDSSDTKVFYNGVDFSDIQILDDRVIFPQAPRNGDVVSIEATLINEHNHAKDTYTYTSTSAPVISLSETPKTNLGVELEDYPIMVFLDGVLLKKADYSVSGDDITLPAAPIGTKVTIWYTTDSTAAHQHGSGTITVTNSAAVFSFGFPLNVSIIAVDGVTLQEGLDYNLAGNDLSDVVFVNPLPPAAVITAVAQETAFTYVASADSFDTNIIRAEFLQNGIDASTVRLEYGVDFTIENEVIYANQRVEPAWFYNADVDEQTVQNNFASFTPFTQVRSSEEFTVLIKAFIAALISGPRVAVIENYSKIILGIPFAPDSGVVTGISETSGVYTITVLAGGVEEDYELPKGISPSVILGQKVDRLQALGDGVQVYDATDNWLSRAPWLAYAIQNYSSSFEVGELYDRGIPSVAKVQMTFNDTPDHRLEVISQAIPDDVRKGDWVEYDDGSTVYRDIIEAVYPSYLQLLDASAGVDVPAAPPTTVDVTIHYRIRQRYDFDLYDSADKDLLEDINQRLYDIFKNFLFLVEINPLLVTDADAVANLVVFLDNVKAASTDYILATPLGAGSGGFLDSTTSGLVETIGVQVQEPVDPADGLSFVLAPAYLYTGQDFVNLNFIGP